MMNNDAKNLEKALKTEGKPVSLGELRRKHEIGPEAALRTVRDYPDRFSETEVIIKGRMAPGIELRSELGEEEKIFIIAVRNAGSTGIAAAKLWAHKRIKSQDSDKFAQKFGQLIRAGVKGSKIMYFWRQSEPSEKSEVSGPAENPIERTELTAAASEPENKVKEIAERLPGTPETDLMKHRDRLLELVRDGVRSSTWLEQFDFDLRLLWKIVSTWPELFTAESVNLGNTEHSEFINIGLRQEEEILVSKPVAATPSLQPALSELVNPSELRELRWKGPCPGMSIRRNNPRGVRGEITRTRRPLVPIE